MVAFSLIPIIAYALIISAFSYISARILKHFSFSSQLLAFLRRQGRLSSLPITNSHELLPMSTASPLARPSIGVYADSSNVTPRSASLDALSALPPRLISPASSPPGHPQPRRVTNPPFTSFSILKPTLYRHRQRRSRSLGLPISRPPHWSSYFPPSPPATIRRRNSEEDIPLSILSQTAEYLSHEHRTRIPAPILHAPSISTTSMPDSDFQTSIYGPLIDISPPPLSPVSTSLSSRQNSSLAGLSYSGSELASYSYPYPASSDTGSPSSMSGSAQSSDIGVQPIGGLRGFAYDWRVNNASNENSDKDDSRTDIRESSPFPLLSSVTIREHVVTVVTEMQSNEDVSHDSQSAEIGQKAAYGATQTDLFQAPEQLDAPPLAENVGQSALTSSVLLQSDPNVDEEILIDPSPPISPALSAPDRLTDDTNLSSLVGDDREIRDDGERPDHDSWNEPNAPALLVPPRVIVQNINVEERPLISIDTSESVKLSDALSPNHPFLMSPSQTPTPPASPPLTPVSVKASTDGGTTQIKVTTNLSISEPASPATTAEEITEAAEEPFAKPEYSPVSQELGQGGPEYDGSDITSPARSDVSLTCSPKNALPACVADAPPLGLNVALAASVQEGLWLNSGPKTDVQIPEVDEVSEHSTEKSSQLVEELAELDSSVPVTFPGPESEESMLVQKQVVNEPASSTTVTMAYGLRQQRQVMRGLPIDIALAMQLRPGLGVGADPAWMVRFLMAVFGWFAIMIAGRGGEVDAYAS